MVLYSLKADSISRLTFYIYLLVSGVSFVYFRFIYQGAIIDAGRLFILFIYVLYVSSVIVSFSDIEDKYISPGIEVAGFDVAIMKSTKFYITCYFFFIASIFAPPFIMFKDVTRIDSFFTWILLTTSFVLSLDGFYYLRVRRRL